MRLRVTPETSVFSTTCTSTTTTSNSGSFKILVHLTRVKVFFLVAYVFQKVGINETQSYSRNFRLLHLGVGRLHLFLLLPTWLPLLQLGQGGHALLPSLHLLQPLPGDRARCLPHPLLLALKGTALEETPQVLGLLLLPLVHFLVLNLMIGPASPW